VPLSPRYQADIGFINYLLKRDLDAASNDDGPAFMDRVA